MGKVYVLAKSDGGIQPTLGPQGSLGLVINTSPENIDYSKYGPSNSNQNKLARRFGNIGSKARYGLGALGALNSFYNTTSSGQPGALTSMGGGAMSGYYGSQGLERQAARHGAKVGVKRDNRERDAVWDEAQDENQQRDAMNMLPEYNKQMHFNQNKVGVTRPPAVSPQIGNQPGQLGYTPGSDANNPITDNLQDWGNGQVAVNGPSTLLDENSQQEPLSFYDSKPPVAVIDPAKLKEIQNESPDGVSSTVAGA